MEAPTPTQCEQLLLPFMVSRPRKLLPDLDRVRRHGGAPIEVKRAVCHSRRQRSKVIGIWHLPSAVYAALRY